MDADLMQRAFVDARGRLHWPWRLAAFALFVLAASLAGSLIAYPITAWVLRTAFGVRLIAFPWITLFALVAAHVLVRRSADAEMTWARLGLDAAATSRRGILGGTALGAASILVPSALLLAIGWLVIEPTNVGGWGSAIRAAMLVLLPAACSEELLFRGYGFAVVRERFGWQVAVGVTSLAFALLHLTNPGAGAQSLALVALAGVWLGVVRVVTESLWATGAAHLAWNAVMALVLHTSVSGLPFSTPGYRVVDAGPAWATGGAWGPEGGAFAALGMMAAMAALLVRPAGRALLARPIGRREMDG